MFSDDTKLMYMALTARFSDAGINSCQGSERGACSPLDLHWPPVTHHATDDNLSIQ